MKKSIVLGVILLLMLGGAFAGSLMSRVEQAKYAVVESYDDLEIRDYAPMIVAQVSVTGPREEAIRAGFRLIADYIFGNNISRTKVSMTAPVMQQTSEQVAMTAPVMQQSNAPGNWSVRFMMPASQTFETLPKPTNDQITFQQVPEKRFAVIRFSGLATQNSLEEKRKRLEDFLVEKKMTALSPPLYAFYNPPWTLPFLRRNEIMIEIKKGSA